VEFEDRIAQLFNSGKIRAPIHLYHGNESEIIEIFRNITDQDWIFTSWRSHYQCLLKGVPEKEIEKAILDGRSIALSFPDYRIFSSAIVAGQIPIAVGTALAIKMNAGKEHVWCFVGDMTSETGMFQTASRYALTHDLPITFVVEDNEVSVLTETRVVWNSQTLRYQEHKLPNVISYKYKSIYPHAGAGKRVQF
jgi:pyruvate dehydrogenase E1 component alpha subunit